MKWRRGFGAVALLAVLLGVPLVFGLGLIDVSKLSWGGGSSTMESDSTASVSIEPAMVVDETLQSGSYFTVGVNTSDVADLYTWHVKLSWNKDVLNGSRIVYGDFLAQTTSTYNTSHTNVDIIATGAQNITGIFNDDGYAWVAESVLGDEPEVGVSGNGTLLGIEFQVVAYGHTTISVNVTGSMPTELLDSTRNSITFATADGYFRNTLPGDMTDDSPETPPSPPDGDVDRYDLGEFADAYGSSAGDPAYNILADLSDDTGVPTAPDGDVDRYDLGVFADNYGTSI